MMIYIALLRGINVGGNSKVPMSLLKHMIESIGCTEVRTYINSGNVIFSDTRTADELQALIEVVLEKELGFNISLLVKDKPAFDKIAAALPEDWRNDTEMKCDVMFLWKEADSREIINELPQKPGVDKVLYVEGALLWCVDRSEVAQSGMSKIVGTALYRKLTIRNCNTVRKLAELTA